MKSYLFRNGDVSDLEIKPVEGRMAIVSESCCSTIKSWLANNPQLTTDGASCHINHGHGW